MAVPKYLSETMWIGSRGYLVEVKQFKDSKQKYMIVTQPELPENQQAPLIVFDYKMTDFMETMERVTEALSPRATALESTATSWSPKRRTPKPATETSKIRKPKANPPEFCNSGKRWTRADDELLVKKFHDGESMESLMSTFKRRTKSIEVRLYKLGLLPTIE